MTSTDLQVNDSPLWTHLVRFDEAARGLALSLTADDAHLKAIAEGFGMSELHSLKAEVKTRSERGNKGDIVVVSVAVKADVTQECGVTLDLFRHEVEADIKVSCAQVERRRSADGDEPEQELSLDDLDEPDRIENGQIDVGQYVIEALGEAYDPFARKPGAVYEEPDVTPEPSPFAVLSQLKRDQ
ncbi:MAG: DUF177 domain-containing protein [Asticcacaulis sp.]